MIKQTLRKIVKETCWHFRKVFEGIQIPFSFDDYKKVKESIVRTFITGQVLNVRFQVRAWNLLGNWGNSKHFRDSIGM